jgi:DNA-binding response OmpR family regulator
MRCLVVEDERNVASFIARSLRENQCSVDIAQDGGKALARASQSTYDLILLDIRLPDFSGIEVCREIRQAGIKTPVLMLTARGLVDQKVEGLDAGADDYLTKPFALAELHARIRALTRRGLHKENASLYVADLEMDQKKRIARRNGKPIPLSPKEFSLLELLMLRSPEAAHRTDIIEHVWSLDFDTETNIVEVYINRLRQKVDQDHPVKLIHTVRGTGYKIGGEAN